MCNNSGKTAVVTGSARGIGLAIAQVLAASNAQLAILDLDDEAAHRAANNLAAQFNIRTWASRLDVSNQNMVEEVFSRLHRELGSTDILVNNASMTNNFGPVIRMSPDNWDREIKTNLSGAFYCAQQALPGMVTRKWGRIINISSAAGALGGFGQCSYSAAKAGLLGLTKTLALEHARHQITANAVLPGLVNTEAAANNIPEHMRSRIINTVPAQRMAEPVEIANIVAFLASPAASYINGAEIMATAGCELFTF